jgi:ArsR family transcriptional regulator, arsenate/arsenite/antimonite-responsive transcriptional repressor
MRDPARFFKVLADEARLQMLWLLFNERELCVCDIMEVLGITQSKASRHLLTMRHAGLVVDRKDGLWSYYQLRDVADPLARRHVELLRETLAQRPEAGDLLRSLRGWLSQKQGCKTRVATSMSGSLTPTGKRVGKATPTKQLRGRRSR